MTKTKYERRRKIYLAARNVSFGARDLVLDGAEVLRIIHENDLYFAPLLDRFTERSVVNTILAFLKEGILGSEFKAKLAFPELFQISPEKRSRHEILELQAAQSAANALKRAVPVDSVPEGLIGGIKNEPGNGLLSSQGQLSLFPVYLTFTAQHNLLTHAQQLLEDCCYSFALKALPDLVSEKGWECSYSVELNWWSELLPDRYYDLAEGTNSAKSAEDLKIKLQATNYIRHIVVHRLPTSANEIMKMLDSAIDLAKTLKDYLSSTKLEFLQALLREIKQGLELEKINLEHELDVALEEMKLEQESLDHKEQKLQTSVFEQDRDNTHRICSILENSIKQCDFFDSWECDFDSDASSQSSVEEEVIR